MTAKPQVKYNTPPTFDCDGVQATSGIRMDGKEETDPIPVAPPLGYTAPPDLMTMIRTMIQSEHLRAELAREDLESFEEADDFEIEDDPLDALTEYEKVFYPPKVPLEPAPPVTPSPSPATKTEVLDTSVLADTSASKNTKPVISGQAQTIEPKVEK